MDSFENALERLRAKFPRDELTGIRQRAVQAIGAGISRRDWHATEVAYNEVCDRLDDLLRRMCKSEYE